MSSECLKKFVETKKTLPFFPHEPVIHVGRFPTDWEVGIEIEMEGSRLPGKVVQPISNGQIWTVHTDGSLRNGGLEYVLSAPIPKAYVTEALEILYGTFKSNGSRLNPSNRCSTHIHINCDGLKINELTSLICLWGVIEDVMVNWCGERRVGNLFCLRLRDADAILEYVKDSLTSGTIMVRDEHRYSAVNFAALRKFGSLEFRSLRGLEEPTSIINWINALLRLKEMAKTKFSDPRNIPTVFSGAGGRGFLEALFEGEPILPELLRAAETERLDIEQSCWEGLRKIQSLIHVHDWDVVLAEIDKVHIKDPFGHKPKKRHLNDVEQLLRQINANRVLENGDIPPHAEQNNNF